MSTSQVLTAESLASTLNLDSADPKLTDNLTGGQIQEILDSLILSAVSPIIRGSNAFDLQVAYLLSYTTRNRKRKLSSLPREASIDAMCQFLTCDSVDEKVRLAATMRLERGFIYNFVVRFLREASGYQAMYTDWVRTRKKSDRKLKRMRLAAIERSVGCSKDTLFQILVSSNDSLRMAYKFRNTIVMNYLRHSFKLAKSFVRMKGKNFDLQDVSQNFLAAVTKAVDKYDASKGALTSYINFWLLNAKTTSNSNHGHEYGIAYSIPQPQKKALADKSVKARGVNFSISLDKMVGGEGDKKELIQLIAGDASVQDQIEGSESLDVIRALVKSADPGGLARLYLDIDEVFSAKERQRMARTMRKQLGVMPTTDSSGAVQYVKVSRNTRREIPA